MAIRIERKRDLSSIKLVVKADDAIGNVDAYDDYIDTLNEDCLDLKGEPTYLVLNFDIKGKDAERIKNAMVQGGEDGTPTIAMGSWQFTIARLTLKGIANPADLPLEQQIVYREKDGKPSEDTLAFLDRIGALANIFAAYQAHVLKPTRAQAKN